jgi:acetyl-CoA synthetase
MIMITRSRATTKPGSATKPFPGVDAAVFDEQGNRLARRERLPGAPAAWPAMLRGIYKDPDRFVDTYWSKYPEHLLRRRGARIDEDGDFWLLDRVDDVMNVSGHRISTSRSRARWSTTRRSRRRRCAAATTRRPARRSSPT